MRMVPKQVGKSSKSNKANGSKQKSASAEEEEKDNLDRSILRQPMDIGLRGVKDLIKALTGGTQEFQELLLNECTIIYECKICRNLFRSLANFISHKRVYCLSTFNYFMHGFSDVQPKNNTVIVKQPEVTVQPEVPQNEPVIQDDSAWVTSDKAIKISETEDSSNNLVPEIKLDPVNITRKRDLARIVDGLSRKGGKEVVKTSADVTDSMYYADIAERVMMRRNARVKDPVELESVNGSCNGVFQTVKSDYLDSKTDSMKLQVIELERVVSKKQATLQENGKFIVAEEDISIAAAEKHKCSFCEAKFMTLRTLSNHIKTHHSERICYPCPLCRIYFASPCSVYRHLSKAHHRTEQQIRRLRSQVLSKASRRKLQEAQKQVPDILGDTKRLQQEKDKWINNFEGVLRCTGCGKFFSRRAVLTVHSATCKEFTAKINQQKNNEKPKPQPKNPPPPQLKSGILVRRDYCKKIIFNSKPLNSSPVNVNSKNCIYIKNSCSLKPGKVESVIQRLHNKTVLEMKEKSKSPVIEREGWPSSSGKDNQVEVETVKNNNERTSRKCVPNATLQVQDPQSETLKNQTETPEADVDEAEDTTGDDVRHQLRTYGLRKKCRLDKPVNGDNLQAAVTKNDDLESVSIPKDPLVDETVEDDSNIKTEEVRKIESVLRRTKRARTVVKNKEYVYNYKRLPPMSRCRTKSVKKAVKQLNYNGSVLLLHKNLQILKSGGHTNQVIKIYS